MRIAGALFLAMLATLPAASLNAQTQTNTAAPALGLAARAQKAHIGDLPLTEGSTIYSGEYVST